MSNGRHKNTEKGYYFPDDLTCRLFRSISFKVCVRINKHLLPWEWGRAPKKKKKSQLFSRLDKRKVVHVVLQTRTVVYVGAATC